MLVARKAGTKEKWKKITKFPITTIKEVTADTRLPKKSNGWNMGVYTKHVDSEEFAGFVKK